MKDKLGKIRNSRKLKSLNRRIKESKKNDILQSLSNIRDNNGNPYFDIGYLINKFI